MRLECIFQIALGCDHMSSDTGDVLLYGKLQDDLLLTPMWPWITLTAVHVI